MAAMTAEEIRTIEDRHPQIFQRPKRFWPLLLIAGTVLYLAYALWFFSLPQVLRESHWERLPLFLSQWISYDLQPEFRLDQPEITPKYPRFSALGEHPDPDWVIKNPDGTFTVLIDGRDKSVTFDKIRATIVANGQTVPVSLTGGKPVVTGPVPDWVTVHDDEIVAKMGFVGEVRVTVDRVKVRKRFLGWANFVFDTRSPFFGKSAGEVISLIASGPDLKPGTSNLALAADNIWNNAQWQHGDVWTKLLQTIVMAFLGTLLGGIVAFPLAFFAARNITPSGLLSQVLKRFFDFMRSVDMLIWALFFTRAFGPGPLAGSAAIFFTEIGTLGKTYSEALENIDDKPREGVLSTGANGLLVQRYGVLPEVVPVFISQTLYQWESNTRGATIIGAVGAGGIGLKLWEAMRTNSNWANVFYMVLLTLLVVFIFDNISNFLRRRLSRTLHDYNRLQAAQG
ncbi:phosphonate ABC transporter, permease protein PhnE [Mesorhizobium sp. CA18]|uniref:phosphonate ABC transporter, permease protein PhnE n=1 Tax=unclassified Mesorhizobium TaxID=325217 RepID=UPI001CCC3B3B|nr:MULTISPECIES: phosphonate ABC transporter, permease protein PhnE [unclassified Mesorhizobium]MBZ9735086.1 phosphonate ABC transporter, permease protein PhnE [Mesorhizobium sp. CA9]MBZ9828464.1 phosphonate ABC transporter, permease protein PhnE [Mesorhizobium sp. CA18]MBZ9833141.1 phosphonate ABC transporter, permease protein PhnE [Mesorhizobium sp. CA2]MBZ9839582.1 phosphonate ABC transporter, permease protein PhnE [Mesorhizobium sp. CA3]MBZ9879556.1 phosphonate ABC transporter, permease pr